jgi:hypothetical protein
LDYVRRKIEIKPAAEVIVISSISAIRRLTPLHGKRRRDGSQGFANDDREKQQNAGFVFQLARYQRSAR